MTTKKPYAMASLEGAPIPVTTLGDLCETLCNLTDLTGAVSAQPVYLRIGDDRNHRHVRCTLHRMSQHIEIRPTD
jgi:hypothetical protein